MSNKIVICLKGGTCKELLIQIKKINKLSEIEILEIRSDYLAKDELTKKTLRRIRESTTKELIFTLRKEFEGGECILDDKKRIPIFLTAIELGYEYIDVEESSSTELIEKIRLNKENSLLLLSFHNFKSTFFSEVQMKYEKMKKFNPDIIKIVTMSNDKMQIDYIKNFLETNANLHPPVSFFYMGRNSKQSRIIGYNFGNTMTYLAINDTNVTAPNQLSYEEFLEVI